MEVIEKKYEEKIMRLVSKLDGESKLALISKIEDSIDRKSLEQIYTKEFLDEIEQSEKDIENGNLIQVNSVEELFGK